MERMGVLSKLRGLAWVRPDGSPLSGDGRRGTSAKQRQATPAKGDDRREQVCQIFTEIAPRYDLLNHVLSLNIDKRWRRLAVGRLMEGLADTGERGPPADSGPVPISPPFRIDSELTTGPLLLDSCAGTCDLALEIARARPDARIVAADFAMPMLVEAASKVGDVPISRACADALDLPFRDDSFAGAAVAFGLRNLSRTRQGLEELRRVLRPGARLVVLEFTTPPNPVVRAGYHLYFRRVLPLVGRVVSGHPWAYSYLPSSVGVFPGPEPLVKEFEEAGFTSVDHQLLSVGIAAIHWGSA